MVSYSAQRVVLEAVARTLARETAPKRFLLNCIAPRDFDSDLPPSLDESNRYQIMRRVQLGNIQSANEFRPVLKLLLKASLSLFHEKLIKINGVMCV